MHRFPERRRRRRIVTLRNFGYLTLAAFVTLLGLNIRSEIRGKRTARDYGRLLERQLPAEIPSRLPPEVVQEQAPIDDQTAPDPMLVAPLHREQWIRPDTYTAEPAVPYTASSQIVVPRDGESRVAIVGGPDGVAVVEQKRRKPVLSGGFGRQ
jgi:hypothetical protein